MFLSGKAEIQIQVVLMLWLLPLSLILNWTLPMEMRSDVLKMGSRNSWGLPRVFQELKIIFVMTLFDVFTPILSRVSSRVFQRLHDLWYCQRFSAEVAMKTQLSPIEPGIKRLAKMQSDVTLLYFLFWKYFYFYLTVIYVNKLQFLEYWINKYFF